MDEPSFGASCTRERRGELQLSLRDIRPRHITPILTLRLLDRAAIVCTALTLLYAEVRDSSRRRSTGEDPNRQSSRIAEQDRA